MPLINFEKILIKLYEIGKERFSKEPVPARTDLYVGETQKLYYRDKPANLFLPAETKAKHLYLIGGTGTGKTTFIEHSIRQEILKGHGFCLLEPHGDLCQNVIRFIASIWDRSDRKGKTEIAKRTIIVEPFNLDAIVPFNPVEIPEGSPLYPHILELTQVFKDKWDDMWGPRMAELFRATLVVLAENKLTLLEAPILLTDTRFRNGLLENLENEEVKNYFVYRYNRLKEWDKVKYREPVINKITEFLTDKYVRYTIGRKKNSFDFREAIDQGKWVILNLSKGRLKINSLLLGGLFLAKFQMAFLSRTDVSFENRAPFALYLDEFQNFISQDEAGDIESMLSESRKYGLSLVLANQNISQLNPKLLGAILGNVNTLIAFRLSRKDAVTIAPELDPSGKDKMIGDLIDMPVGQAFVKITGEPGRLTHLPFPQPSVVSPEAIAQFREHTHFFHASSHQRIESEIRQRHQALGIRPDGNPQPDERIGRNQERNTRTIRNGEGQDEW